MSSVFDRCDGGRWSGLKMSRCVSDGVVLIDPEYLKERKGETPEQNRSQNQNQTCCSCC